jgi:hypothetical protein
MTCGTCGTAINKEVEGECTAVTTKHVESYEAIQIGWRGRLKGLIRSNIYSDWGFPLG